MNWIISILGLIVGIIVTTFFKNITINRKDEALKTVRGQRDSLEKQTKADSAVISASSESAVNLKKVESENSSLIEEVHEAEAKIASESNLGLEKSIEDAGAENVKVDEPNKAPAVQESEKKYELPDDIKSINASAVSSSLKFGQLHDN
ncbi:MAG: hypothetical protein ACQGQO_04760 [Sphaerochaetaceae bacterium]